jgi:UDP-N-acetyl-D-glucosamine dehydrogenase
MPYFVVNKAVNTLSASGICPSEAQILILGMAFKKDIGDLRDSPAIKVYKIIRDRVKTVLYNDPYASEVVIDKKVIKSVELNKRVLTESDLVIIVTDHSVYDYPWIVENARLIFDTRNAIKRKNKKVIRLGAG